VAPTAGGRGIDRHRALFGRRASVFQVPTPQSPKCETTDVNLVENKVELR
jgi:hypothetical protein